MRVLLIDNDIESLDKLRSGINDHYIVDVANNGEEGSYLSQVNEYSAIVVESNLPDIDNTEFCKQTRTYDDKVPILMLLDEDNLESKLSSLNCGADIVLTKPVSERELRAYLRILINRAQRVGNKHLLQARNIKLNLRTKEVFRGRNQIVLRRKEYELLRYMLLNKGRVLTKEQILENVWDYGIEVASNTLEVHIKSLRDKIDTPYKTQLIRTVYGFGYKVCV